MTETKKPRGFAALTPEKRRELARKGGQQAHKNGTAHVFDKAEARAAGSRGGKASHAKRKVSDLKLEFEAEPKT